MCSLFLSDIYYTIIDIRPKTCQDYGCCYEKFPSSFCEHEKVHDLYLDDETEIYTESDCSNRTDSCRKYNNYCY